MKPVEKSRLTPWLSIVAVLGSQLLAVIAIGSLMRVLPALAYYPQTPIGTFLISATGGIAAFLTVVLITRPTSVFDFLTRFKLQLSEDNIRYSFVVFGSILGCIGVFVARLELTNFAKEYVLTKPFIHANPWGKSLRAILLLAAPVVEEIVVRGFVYQSFRQCYSICSSVIAVLLLEIILHWSQMRSAIPVFILLATLQIILCLILEKTRNLWNCILFHCAYNGILVIASVLGF
jgi:membrane protease YdiL (CAAX protease family)